MKFPLKLAGAFLLLVSLPLLLARPNAADSRVKTIYPKFRTIDVPGAGATGVYGINSLGDMAGYYASTYYDPHDHGFLIKGGKFMHIDYPGSYATVAYGINDSGMVAGLTELQHGYLVLGFLYDGSVFRRFHDGNGGSTRPYGINNANSIVGAAGTLNTTDGFLEEGGQFTAIHFPGQYVYGAAAGINDLGEIVGYTDYDAYLYSNGQFQSLDVPGAYATVAFGVNDKEVIVGWYLIGAQTYGFAFSQGRFVSFSYPGASFTAANGISESGEAVGEYQLADNQVHGFVTSPISTADFR